jgi:hypothetical protein
MQIAASSLVVPLSLNSKLPFPTAATHIPLPQWQPRENRGQETLSFAILRANSLRTILQTPNLDPHYQRSHILAHVVYRINRQLTFINTSFPRLHPIANFLNWAVASRIFRGLVFP